MGDEKHKPTDTPAPPARSLRDLGGVLAPKTPEQLAAAEERERLLKRFGIGPIGSVADAFELERRRIADLEEKLEAVRYAFDLLDEISGWTHTAVLHNDRGQATDLVDCPRCNARSYAVGICLAVQSDEAIPRLRHDWSGPHGS